MDITGKRILCLFAHPDDETFICGGTLAAYAKRGAGVVVVSATRGEMGRRMGKPPKLTRESMPRIREEELRDACRRLGIEAPRFLDIRDKTVEFADAEALHERLRGLIRDFAPDLVLTFHPERGGHPDHNAIGRAALAAAAAEAPAAPPVYFISFGDAALHWAQSDGLEPSFVTRVDVSDGLKEKLRAFRAHRSQTEMDEWLWKDDQRVLERFGRFEYFLASDRASAERAGAWFGNRL